MAALVLKPGREKSLLRRHPWVFSGAVHHVEGQPASGETLDVVSSKGEFLGRAFYSPNSQIRARMWTFKDEEVDADFLRGRIRTAVQARDAWNLQSDTDAFRLIHAESDGLPGLIVDRYADTLVLQSLATGPEYWKDAIAAILLEQTGLKCIYERSDADVRELEGLPAKVGSLRGGLPKMPITIQEYGLKFLVDIENGHKTGFYLDQRFNRHRVGELADGRDVLNCFCYTGGFAIHALRGGAKSVLSVDTSAEALALGCQNVAINNLPAEKSEWVEADVFQLLRKLRDEGQSFDMVILDPPKFAPTVAQAEKAARGYKDINLLAFKLLRPGGLLVTFSCSGGVDAALFQKIVAGAALDAGVEAQIIEHVSQAIDHPVSLYFPEGTYLKGLICYKPAG